MIVLDCESRESALASVAAVYGVSPAEIDRFLRSFDVEAHYSKNDPHRPPDEELRILFEQTVGCVAAPIDRVCWFHLTRTDAASDFSNGIQPLSTVRDHVWGAVLKVFRGTKHELPLLQLRRDGVPDFQYGLKSDDSFHSGPYAMLVRAAALHSHEIGNHDYLWLPETMEDICNGYQKVHGESIHEELNQGLVPMIVKFWSVDQRSDNCVGVAMYYLYITLHSREMLLDANTCYDGENVAIPPERILRVEVAEDYRGRHIRTQTTSPRVNVTRGDGCIVFHLNGEEA